MDTTPGPRLPDCVTHSKLLGPCDGCGGEHEATYSHEGRWGQGPIYAVVCPVDWLITYVTSEVVVYR